MKEEERAYFQGLVDDIYQQFVNAVASERRMSSERIRPYADGRVFTGKAAKDIGLIDTIGTFYDAVDDLKGYYI
jgi:protease-4